MVNVKKPQLLLGQEWLTHWQNGDYEIPKTTPCGSLGRGDGEKRLAILTRGKTAQIRGDR